MTDPIGDALRAYDTPAAAQPVRVDQLTHRLLNILDSEENLSDEALEAFKVLDNALSARTPTPVQHLRGSALRAHYERELTRIIAEWEERRDVLLADEEAKGRFLILRSFELAAEGRP